MVKFPLAFRVKLHHFSVMEEFILEIEAYAAAVDRTPQAVLRSAVSAGWGTWDAWVSRKSSPTMALADRIRDYMKANPPPPQSEPEKDVA